VFRFSLASRLIFVLAAALGCAALGCAALGCAALGCAALAQANNLWRELIVRERFA
jgi:hypothetical protein